MVHLGHVASSSNYLNADGYRVPIYIRYFILNVTNQYSWYMNSSHLTGFQVIGPLEIESTSDVRS